jgi:hypothetical protein
MAIEGALKQMKADQDLLDVIKQSDVMKYVPAGMDDSDLTGFAYNLAGAVGIDVLSPLAAGPSLDSPE